MNELTPRKIARINRAALAIALVKPKVEVDSGNGYRIGRLAFESHDQDGKFKWVLVVTCNATTDPNVGYRHHELRKVRGTEELYAGEGYTWLDTNPAPDAPSEILDAKPPVSIGTDREAVMRLFSPEGSDAFHAGIAMVDEAFEAITDRIFASLAKTSRGSLPETVRDQLGGFFEVTAVHGDLPSGVSFDRASRSFLGKPTQAEAVASN